LSPLTLHLKQNKINPERVELDGYELDKDNYFRLRKVNEHVERIMHDQAKILIELPEEERIKVINEQITKEINDYHKSLSNSKVMPFPFVLQSVILPENAKHLSESGL